MNQIITFFAIVLLAAVTTVKAGCDATKEFGAEADAIKAWADIKCEAAKANGNKLQKCDVKHLSDCYAEKMSKIFANPACATKISDHLTKVLFVDDKTLSVCHDKKIQDAVKKEAIKGITMKAGMDCKKHVEADCPTYKKALGQYTDCVKAKGDCKD